MPGEESKTHERSPTAYPGRDKGAGGGGWGLGQHGRWLACSPTLGKLLTLSVPQFLAS